MQYANETYSRCVCVVLYTSQRPTSKTFSHYPFFYYYYSLQPHIYLGEISVLNAHGFTQCLHLMQMMMHTPFFNISWVITYYINPIEWLSQHCSYVSTTLRMDSFLGRKLKIALQLGQMCCCCSVSGQWQNTSMSEKNLSP